MECKYCHQIVEDGIVDIGPLSRYAHCFDILTQYIFSPMNGLSFRDVFMLHGLPKAIDSDGDNYCMSSFFAGASPLGGY